MKKLKITVNGKEYEVDVEILEDTDHGTMPMQAQPFPYQGYQPAVAPPIAPSTLSAPPPKPKPAVASSGNANELTSPMNGVVLEIPVQSGQKVKEGDVVVVLEAMKMKTNISSSQDGVIGDIKIKINDSVEAGQVLLTYA